MDCNQLTNLVNKESACLVDVRPKSEFDAGAIAGSVNIPFEELENRNDELLKEKDEEPTGGEGPSRLECRRVFVAAFFDV